MAGHSKFKNIMYRKGAQDKKRAKLFTKLIREITVAARSGIADPEKNPRLRSAVSAANSANMPKDTIERAVLRGSDNQKGETFEEICYEGFGAGGISIIIDALTDNRNRAAAEIRSCFAKYGGRLGETGSVSHMYEKVGLIHYSSDEKKSSEIFDRASDFGAEDVIVDDLGCDIFCKTERVHDLRLDLEKFFGPPDSAGLTWKAKNLITIGESDAQSVIGLIQELDGLEDVQSVYSDYDIPEEVMNKLVA
jgi:YebC/PmpR family DNA-binding regulatory protein